MEMKVNVELVLAFYKQRVAELEYELIIQQAVNETLKAEIQKIQNDQNDQNDHE